MKWNPLELGQLNQNPLSIGCALPFTGAPVLIAASVDELSNEEGGPFVAEQMRL